MEAAASATRPPTILQLLASDLRWTLVTALVRSDRQVHELVTIAGQPANLVSYHLRKLRSESVVKERRSSADARDVYYSLDLDRLRELYSAAADAVHPGLNPLDAATVIEPRKVPARILFLCTRNAARSQMAEAIMRRYGGENVKVFSAGRAPSKVHPDAIASLNALGIDISSAQSKHFDQFLDQRFDYIITVCDRVREVCPVFPGDPERIHWSFADPSVVEDPAERRQAFDLMALQLQTRIRYLLTLIDRG